ELSDKIGKSRSHISNAIRLLSLPDDVIAFVNSGELSMGHARAILGLKEKDQVHALVRNIIRNKLNVRQVENLVNSLNEQKQPKGKKRPSNKKDIFVLRQEEILREHLRTKVKIEKNKQKGKIEIEFYSNEELEKLINVLKN